MTTWRPTPSFPGYEASDDGRVRSVDRMVKDRWGGTHLRRGRTLSVFTRRGGYLGGNASINGKRKNFEVHVVVCEAFHGERPSGLEVRHLNGNKQDNRPGNLAWGTKSENMLDKVRHGVHHEANRAECRQGHPYSEENTYRAPGAPNKRHCRTCMRAHERARSRTSR